MRAQIRLLSCCVVALSVALTGCGDDDPTAPRESVPPKVGAAFLDSGGELVILVDASGSRFVVHDPTDGSFTGAQPISALGPGYPLENIEAAGTMGSNTYLVDQSGAQMTTWDHDDLVPSFPVQTFGDDLFANAPFETTEAIFTAGDTIFFFNQAGTRYCAYNTANETWSPVYDFLTDFGGGGAPIPNVGAAYQQDTGSYVLFSAAGDQYAIYSSGGRFSQAFATSVFGDGSLRF